MRFHHVGISVTDLDASIRFYTEHFGCALERRFTKDDWNGEAAILRCGDVRLELFWFRDSKAARDDQADLKVAGIKHLAFAVDDVRKAYEELKAKGVDIDPPRKGTTCTAFAFLHDPSGNSIELYQA